MKFKFGGADGKMLSYQGWGVSQQKSVNTMCAPLHCDGKVVLLLVAAGDECDDKTLIARGKFIEAACNSQVKPYFDVTEKLIKALREIVACDRFQQSSAGLIARRALADAGLSDE